MWFNGHEWAKRQATKAGLGFTPLANGFAACTDPAALQSICDRLSPATIGVFFERWMSRLPLPLGPADRAAGYWWELSIRLIGHCHPTWKRPQPFQDIPIVDIPIVRGQPPFEHLTGVPIQGATDH